MTPSQSIIQGAAQPLIAADTNGRRLTVRRLTALDTLRLFKAAGPVLAQNEPWLSMAGLAFSVLEIDGLPVPPPTTESQIEKLIERLGEAGLIAIADTIADNQDIEDPRLNVGNFHGIQS